MAQDKHDKCKMNT